MALTINISNTGQTTQPLSLFSTGASGVSDFVYSPNGIAYQGVENSYNVGEQWVYVGNNVWTLSGSLAFSNEGWVLFLYNYTTNTIVALPTVTIPIGSTNTVAGNLAKASWNSSGFSCDVIVTPQYLTPTNVGVFITIINNDPKTWNVLSMDIYDGSQDPSVNFVPTNNLSYLAGNPFVTSQSNVPLNQVQESTNGYSYLIKSMYVVSTNPAQLLVPINYGTRDANGDIQYQILANTIDPRQNNSSAIRTSGMNNFIFDDSTVFQFDALAQTNVSIKYEFEQLGYDEIKKQAVGVELRKKFAKMEMENEEKADDFQNFYFFQ